MVIVPAKLALRMLFMSMFCATALILFAGRAHADDATAPDPAAAQQAPAPDASTPPPPETVSTPPPSTGDATQPQETAPPAGAPPADNSQLTPPADNSQSTPPADPSQPAPAGNSQQPPADNTSTQPPTGAQDQPQSPTPAGASGPGGATDTNNQNANVGTQGTSVSNTGANGSVASGTGSTPTTGNSSTGTVSTGTSNATGTDSTSGIDQQAQASATDQGAVDILQIALIVNVGVGQSNSGNNVAGAGSAGAGGPGTTTSQVQSGNAGAVGDASKTGVKQSAVIGNGDNSNQTALVVNIGIGIGNSGLNITIGTVDNNGQSAGTNSVTSGQTTGQIATGDATAIGDKSTSHISQIAGGTASGTAVLTIDQRAIVVNFGTAIANSGGNVAYASFDPSSLTPQEAAIVSAVLNILAPFFAPQQQATGTGGAMGSTIAKVISGDASATGTAATTDINQSVTGNVSGNGSASAQQRAEVGNFGLALANSGFNGALAGVPTNGVPGAQAQLLDAQNALLQFLSLLTNLSWLDSQNPFAQFSQTVDLGGVTLNLGGSLTGEDFLLGWDSGYAPDGGPIPGGVRVRQISGVLNIGFSISDSGDNTVVALVTSTHDGTGSALNAKNGVAAGHPDVLASVLSGNASAVGNMSDVMVCQAFHTTITCRPPAPPDKPPVTPPPIHIGSDDDQRPPVVIAQHDPLPAPTANAGPSTGTLPFTGGDSRGMIELAGALLAVGATAASRRRRSQRV